VVGGWTVKLRVLVEVVSGVSVLCVDVTTGASVLCVVTGGACVLCVVTGGAGATVEEVVVTGGGVFVVVTACFVVVCCCWPPPPTAVGALPAPVAAVCGRPTGHLLEPEEKVPSAKK
jgi:hypothetical protein